MVKIRAILASVVVILVSVATSNDSGLVNRSKGGEISFAVQRGNLIETIVVQGVVSHARETLIYTPKEGVLQEYSVQVGDHVNAGQVLTVLKFEAVDMYNTNASLHQTEVLSTRDGVVLSLEVPIGMHLNANQALLAVGEPEQLEIRASLSLEELDQVQIGMKVDISVSDQPGSQVSGSISYAPCYTCMYSVGLLEVEDQIISIRWGNDLDLSLGDAVEVCIYLKYAEDILWLPPAAIQDLAGEPYVFLLVNNHLEVSMIEIGLQTNSQIEIISGLDEGQLVFEQ